MIYIRVTVYRALSSDFKMDIRDIRLGAVSWTNLAQDREKLRTVVNTIRNLRVP
jgi:hypothetical protein